MHADELEYYLEANEELITERKPDAAKRVPTKYDSALGIWKCVIVSGLTFANASYRT